MLVDMHLHECTYSTDSFLHLEEIVSIARQKGLDAICITDHDSMGLRERAEAYSREIGYPIFVGVEFFSLWGDITAWGIDGIPDHRIDAQDFIDLVREKDGFCVSCHPFRNNNRGLREHLRDVHGLDGVEVLNGSTPLEENRTALRFCRELGLKAGTGGKIRDMAARNGHNAARFCHRAAHAGNASRHLDGQRVRCRHRVLR